MARPRTARPGSPTTALAYLRASTEDQRLGPEAQRASITAWAAREGVTVVAWFEDLGRSGAAGLEDRPGLAAALAALRSVGAGVLAVARRDRLARDVALAAAIDRAVEHAGAKVRSADGAGDGDGPADRLLRGMLDLTAEYERALIRTRTRAALQAKRARGERAGEVPYGFTADSTGRLEENPAEQAVIKHVLDLRAAGLSLRGVTAELARVGIVSRSGKPLGLTQVARMVRGAT